MTATNERAARGTAAGAPLAPGAIAERVLEVVRGKAADVEAEVLVRTGRSALTRFANSFVHQNVAEDVSAVRLRVALDGRVAASGLEGSIGGEALARLVDDTLEAARVRPVDPDWPGLAPAVPAPGVEHWDEATAIASPTERARHVRAFVDGADGLETAGFCSTDGFEVAFANSAGQRLGGRGSVAIQQGIARTSTSDGGVRLADVSLAALDSGSLGRVAGEKARTSAAPTDLEPGRYPVILEPAAVVDLLHFLFIYGFNGRSVEEGRSFARVGEAQFDPAISIREDVTDPGQIGVPFDAEGTPKRRVDIVGRGVTEAILHTRRTAAKAGTTSTGSAVPGGDDFGALPENIVVGAGDRSFEELLAGMDRGLLVTEFHYTRILDPRTTVVTGLTRNGVWLIENGRIARPVKNLRFTQSYHEALAPGAVLGVGRDRSLVPAEWELGASLVPALHLASWNFTGGARG